MDQILVEKGDLKFMVFEICIHLLTICFLLHQFHNRIEVKLLSHQNDTVVEFIEGYRVFLLYIV